jgi:tetratricopeptide (TPR) repeat protein
MNENKMPDESGQDTAKSTSLERACTLCASGDYEEALAHLVEVLKEEPMCAEAYRCLGKCKGGLGDWSGAYEAFQRLIQLRPGEPEGHTAAASACLMLGRPECAIDEANRALRIRADDAGAHIYKLTARMMQAEPDRCELMSELEQFKTLFPEMASLVGRDTAAINNEHFLHAFARTLDRMGTAVDPADLYVVLGHVQRAEGEYERAADAYCRALRAEPRHTAARAALGALYLELGRYEDALRIFKEGVGLGQTAFEFAALAAEGWNWYHIAASRDDDGTERLYLKALKRFEESIAKTPPEGTAAYSYLGIGCCRVRLGNHSLAAQAYREALRLDPTYAEAHWELGRLHIELGHYSDAVHSFREALCIDPQDKRVWYDCGYAYYRMGQMENAIEAYEHVVSLDREHVDAYCDLANCYAARGEHGKAVELNQEALRFDPRNVRARLQLGDAYYNLDQFEQAAKAYDAVLQQSPDDASAWRYFGGACQHLDRYDEAIGAYHRLLEIDPDDTQALGLLADCFSAEERFAEAYDAYQEVLEREPGNCDALVRIAESALNLDRPGESVEYCTRALELCPCSAEAHYILGVAYLALERRDSALRECETLKELGSTWADDLIEAIGSSE